MELNKNDLNTPLTENLTVLPIAGHQNASTSAYKEKRTMMPPKPLAKPLYPVRSFRDSSSTCLVTLKRRDDKQQKPNDAQHHPEATALSRLNRTSVFQQLGAKIRIKAKS